MKTRSDYAIINVIVGFFGQISQIIVSFIIRTVFINYLGKEMLGIDSLFTNILSILSISELGLNTAIVYSLYTPLLKKDKKKISAYMNIYKKCYFYIGTSILILGLIVLLNLNYFISTNISIQYLRTIFVLYLSNTLVTYWGKAYKSSILIADQKSYINIFVMKATIIARSILQLIVLILFRSMIGYLVITFVFSVLKNTIISKIVNQQYPYLENMKKEKINKNERNNLIKNVIGMSTYKISSTVSTSTDNLIISKFINIIAVGIYSNYILIISSIKMIINSIFSSVTASIGNLNATNDIEKNYFVFKTMSFLCFVFYSVSSVCLFTLLNKFIKLWLGDNFLLNNSTVFIIVLDYLTDGLQRAVIIYKDACGLFWKGKFRPVFSAVLNIFFSLILVKKFDLLGIIFGTILSRILTTWWFDPILVYKNVFKRSSKTYFLNYIEYLMVSIIMCLLTYKLISFFNIGNLYVNFIISGIMSLILPLIILIMMYYKKEEMKYLFRLLYSKIKIKGGTK